MDIQPNASLPPVVDYKEESSFWSDLFSILIGIIIIGGLIGGIIYQHYLYDELKFQNCQPKIISPIPNGNY